MKQCRRRPEAIRTSIAKRQHIATGQRWQQAAFDHHVVWQTETTQYINWRERREVAIEQTEDPYKHKREAGFGSVKAPERRW